MTSVGDQVIKLLELDDIFSQASDKARVDAHIC